MTSKRALKQGPETLSMYENQPVLDTASHPEQRSGPAPMGKRRAEI